MPPRNLRSEESGPFFANPESGEGSAVGRPCDWFDRLVILGYAIPQSVVFVADLHRLPFFQ